jgi:cyclopropane-fatty-acyl-phospholipid synthase
LFLLHTIGVDKPRKATDPWFEKYIFPGGVLPSVERIAQAAEGQFVVEHFHSFGPYYDQTLMAWYDNFRNTWYKYEHEYGERFFRMWSYYLLSSAGAFRARSNQLWQWVFSKHGVLGGYEIPAWAAKRGETRISEREYEYADS